MSKRTTRRELSRKTRKNRIDCLIACCFTVILLTIIRNKVDKNSMKATLFLPYAVGDPVKGFVYDDPNFTDRKYIQIMTEDYNNYKDSVNMAINSSYNRGGGFFGSGLAFLTKNKIKREYVKQEYQYNSCECTVRDMYGNDETIDNLIRYFQKGDQFIIILKLHNMSKNPDLETEMKMWLKESNHINFSNRLTEEEKIYNLPKKDFKLTFTDAKSSAIFKECKIVEGYSTSEYAIIVNKIIFVVDR